jgi:hypothetical protein
MSFISPSDALGASGLGTANLPPINPADLPAAVRNGSPAAKKAFDEGLAFEQVLVNQLAQRMTDVVSQTADSSDDGSSDAGSSGGGMLGSDPSTSAFSSLIPQALSNSIMSGGGLGIAQEIAASLDPELLPGGVHR